MSSLVIVESPTKARTIGKFLGKDYEIKASMGHVMDLPKSKLGVEVDDKFAPQYEVIPDKAKVIAELRKAAKTATEVILATDPDREGEAIAYYVAEVLSGKKTKKVLDSYKRIVFHEITNEAIQEALTHPRHIDFNLVDAQTARRVLDRLVGYKLSPLLWQKVRRGLSAGRVQSVALRLIVEREKEIKKFQSEPYWTIGTFFKKPEKEQIPVDFELIEIEGKKIEEQKTFPLYDGEYKVSKTTITTEDQAKKLTEDIQKSNFSVADVIQKETKRSPGPPLTTSTLQQEAARRLGLNGKRTMSLAQKLYEEGFITYHRTDSVSIAGSAVGSIRNYITKEFGEKYAPEKPRYYSAKQKLAQEAHEAIRPTKVSVSAAIVSQELGGAYGKLYEIIWRRAVASQMSDARIDSTTVLVDSTSPVIASGAKQSQEKEIAASPSAPRNDKTSQYRFKANGSVLLFDGFLKINPQALQDNRLPNFVQGESLQTDSVHSDAHQTSSPPRYNDASLIKTLEEKGIGRPSTYASIVSTIEERRYVERLDARLVPTTIGDAVNEFLVKNFSDIDDIPFTADMEDQLDEIAQGKREWEPMMAEFYKPFEKKLEIVKKADRVKIAVEQVDEKCPKCGANLVIRIGRFGKFLSCSKFPDCDFSKPYIEETGQDCPKCLLDGRENGKVIVRKTRKGRIFYGCSNYPACDFAAWNLNDVKNYDPARESAKRKARNAKKKGKTPNLSVSKHVVKRGKVKRSPPKASKNDQLLQDS